MLILVRIHLRYSFSPLSSLMTLQIQITPFEFYEYIPFRITFQYFLTINQNIIKHTVCSRLK